MRRQHEVLFQELQAPRIWLGVSQSQTTIRICI